MNETSGIQTYAVGYLQAINGILRLRLVRDLPYGDRIKARKYVTWQLQRELRGTRRHFANRDWHAIRNQFNGYLAEWDYPPEGMLHNRCGAGWTRRGAVRRLGTHIARLNTKATS